MPESVDITIAEQPLLRAAAFVTRFPAPLARVPPAPQLEALLDARAVAPFGPDDELRAAVRDMLRFGGYKPTGRGKPASEYLAGAARDGRLRSINAAVDACNVASLHSGLPISVVDLDRAAPPFRIAIAAQGERYVFNPAGQEIDIGGLVCLFDAAGACANAVRDAQRTKTGDATTRTLSVVWGCAGHEARLAETLAWYRDLLHGIGAPTAPAALHAT